MTYTSGCSGCVRRARKVIGFLGYKMPLGQHQTGRPGGGLNWLHTRTGYPVMDDEIRRAPFRSTVRAAWGAAPWQPRASDRR